MHAAIAHPAIIPLLGTPATDAGPALVYPWVDGEVLYGAPPRRAGPAAAACGPHARFRSLPVADVISALDAIFDAHLAVAAAGFVSVDLYDGCFIYDFAARRMWICDLDEYRPGPFRVDTDRLRGSTRFMAAEELRRDATVDQRTTCSTSAAPVSCCSTPATWTGRSGQPGHGGGPGAGHPARRHATVAEFVGEWRVATT